MTDINLNKLQQTALSYIQQGYNLFLTGGGGVGKSAIIKYYIKMNKHLKNIAITSSTGTSALLINGTTLHSYLGIGLGNGSAGAMLTKICKKRYLYKRWTEMEILIIDEISMISGELFDKIEYIARMVRKSKKPFGGIQLILSGDFCQLKPIKSELFCFEAESWEMCVDKIVNLKEIIRQHNKTFQYCLNNIRQGIITDKIKSVFRKCIGKELVNDVGIIPTELYSNNYLVDNINKTALNNLITENQMVYEYNLEFKNYGNDLDLSLQERYIKSCPVSQTLELCKNCQVILTYNIDLENKLVNGSRGVVIDFVDDLPLVRFLNGLERIIDYNIWEIEENDQKMASITQIPLKLGYAMSIHKSQGCSLDYVIMDLTDTFDYGMAYVALSRVKSLDGLSIIGVNWDKININPKAKLFYEKIENEI